MVKRWTPIDEPLDFFDSKQGLTAQLAADAIRVEFVAKLCTIEFSDDEPLIRLCELVEVPAEDAPTPPATLYCAKCGDGLDNEAVCSVCYDTLESAYDEVVAKLDASSPAVPVDVDYTIRVALEVMRRRAVDVAAVDAALAWLNTLQPRPGK